MDRPHRKSVTALVVDDDPKRSQEIARILKQFDFRVETASSGTEAVKMYEESPYYDLVLLNTTMRVGIAAGMTTRLIRSHQMAKRPYVIGFVTSDDNQSGLPQGMDLLAYWPLVSSVSRAGTLLSLLPGGRTN